MKNTYLVITSIAAPNAVLKSYATLCKEKGVKFVVIGDTKSPADFNLPGCDFYSVERQSEISDSFSKLLPTKHYSRKNLAYVLAKNKGAENIIETDDDNYALPDFFDFFPEKMELNVAEEKGWLNVYNHFSETNIWPRGLPLDRINDERLNYSKLPKATVHVPIQQGLANENPDVDAVYRLTYKLPLNFDSGKKVALGKNTWCPFNSQNTVWYPAAYPLLYLPSYCSFRMTDIWRSFVAQRIAWENGWNILFFSPTVWQERNEHNLMKDFADEISGYLHNDSISKELQLLPLKSGVSNIGENMVSCYKKLIEMGLVDAKELDILNVWLRLMA